MKKIKEDIDIVYLLGKGSKYDDIELLISLRSVDTYLKHYRNIYIVGEDVSDIIKSDDKHKIINIVVNISKRTFPQKRKLMKLVNLCKEHEELSENFLLMSDDYIFCAETDARDIPYFYKGQMVRYLKRRVITTGMFKEEVSYEDKMTICNDDTFRVLASNKMSKKNYETKTPFIINKKRFIKMIESFYWDVFRFGLLYKTLYANYSENIVDTIKAPSAEISEKVPDETLEQFVKMKPFISLGDKAVNQHSILFFLTKFYDKSRWEI